MKNKLNLILLLIAVIPLVSGGGGEGTVPRRHPPIPSPTHPLSSEIRVSVGSLASAPNDYLKKRIRIENFELTDVRIIPFFGTKNLYALGLKAGGKDYQTSFSPKNSLNFVVNEETAHGLQPYLKSGQLRQNSDFPAYIIADFEIFDKGKETLRFVAVRCVSYDGKVFGDC